MLSKAKTAPSRAHCTLGKATKPRHVARRHVLHVNGHAAQARAIHPNHYRVHVTLR